MRVAIVATSYPRAPDDAAGHFVRAEALARARGGDEVHVIAPEPFGGDPGVRAHPAGGGALFAWPGAASRARRAPHLALALGPFALRAARALRALAPDAVVAHWLVPSAFPIALAAPASAPLEAVCHGADVRLLVRAPASARALALGRLEARGARLRFAAESLREALFGALPAGLARALAPRSRVEAPALEALGGVRAARAARPYVACVGRLVATKRFDVAVRALALCPPPLELRVIGEGPDRARLERVALAAAPGRVHFHGRLGRDEALSWLAGAAALAHPSACDAAPTAVREAMALGVPVVAAEVGDTARWAASGAPLRLAERTPEAFAAALAELAGRPAR
ncbi:MAG TPA: glycosyltransferase family 4 protein [Polyangiaceae bacterium]|nr:glycosyltransferase family 4 protein [Polyangiaceae bacterium]